MARLEQARTKEEQVALRRQLARLVATAGDAQGAQDHFAAAFELIPTDEALHTDTLEVLGGFGLHTETTQLLEPALRRMRRGRQEQALVRTLARVHWHERGDVTAAEKLWRRVKLGAPRDPEMLSFYAELYAQQGDHKRLLSALASLQAAQPDVDDKVETGRRMARLAEEELDNLDKAIDVWKGIGRIAPNLPEVRESLKRLYRLTGKWNALLEYHKQEIGALAADATEEKVAIYEQMITIYQEHLHLDVMVINTFNALLQVDPTNGAALDALSERYEAAARWNDLIGVLKRKEAQEEDADARIELLRRIATLYLERFRNQAQAVKPLEKVLELRPDDRGAMETLKGIYRQRRDWRSLLGVLAREVDTVEGDERATLLEEAAGLAQERLNKPDQAIGFWRQRLELAEGALPEQAVEALDALYTRARQHGDLAGLLALQLERMSAGPQERYGVLCRLGRLLISPLERPEEAVATWSEALEIAPEGDAEPRQALERLYLDAQAWDELEALLQAALQTDHLADLLERAAQEQGSGEQQAALWRRVIAIAAGPLQDEDRVLRAREALLNIEPDNLDVVRALVPVYRERAAWERLSAMLEKLLEHEEQPDERLQLFRSLWALHEEQLGDDGVAFRWCATAFAEFPGADVEAELVRLAERTDAWESLVLRAREVAERLEDSAYQLSLHLTLGEICRSRLGWVDESIEYFGRALLEDPDCAPALDALEDLYARSEGWGKLLEVLQRKLALADQDGERYSIQLRIAQLNEEFLEAPEDAIAAFSALLDLDAGSLEALRGLERLYRAQQQWPELAETLQRQVELAEDVELRSDRIFALALIHEDHLDARPRAVELYAQLLDLDAAHGPTVRRLEGLLARPVEPQRVAGLLEPVYRERQDWEKLADVLAVLVEGADGPGAQVALLKEVAQIAEDRLDDPSRALDGLLQAFPIVPTDHLIWDELDRLAGALEAWNRLAAAFGDAVEDPDNELPAEDRLELALRVAEVREKQERPEEAAAAYTRALELDESSEPAIGALQRLYVQLERWRALADILELKAGLQDDAAERCAILFRVAALLEENLEAPAEAIGTYLRIIDLAPERLDAWLALERLYGAAGQHRELGDVLTRLIESQGRSEEGLAAQHRLGQVQQLHLGDPLGALASYRAVLAEQPHPETVEALELLLANPPEALVAPDEFLRSITEVLEPVYADAGQAPDLIRILRRRLEVSRGAEEQVELLVRVSELHTGEGEAQQAFEAMGRALSVAPYREDVAERLEGLADEQGAWAELVEALERALQGSNDPPVRVRLLRQAATVSVRELGRLPEAEAFLRAILDLDGADGVALDDLERCLRQQGDHEAVVEVLGRKVALAVDAGARIELLHQMAEVLDVSLERAADAVETYREVLDIDDREPRALDALERLLEGGERWDELVPVLLHRVACVETVEQRKRLYARVAVIFDERLDDAGEAIGAYRSLLDLDADDRDALAELDQLYEREARWVELLETLQRRVELSAQPQERAELQLRQGHLLAEQLESPLRAIECFREVLEAAPHNAGARAALEAMLNTPDHRSRAAEVLEPFYLTLEAWEPLRDSLEIRLLDLADPVARLELLLRISQLCEARLGDADGAFDALARAFAERRSDPRPVEGLHRLATQLDRWADLVEIFEAGAQEELDGVVAKDLRLRVARIQRRELEDPEAAQAAFRKVLEVDPEDAESLDSLEELYQQLESYEELLGIYRTKVEVSADDDVRVGLLLRMAELQRDVLERAEGAIESLRQVLSLDEDHRDANQSLTEILRSEERWADLADHYLRQLSAAPDTTRRIGLKFDLGRLYMDRLDNPGGAIDCFREVLDERPSHEASVEALETYISRGVEVEAVADILEPLYRQSNEWEKVVDVVAARRAAADDPLRRSELALRIGGILELNLQNPDGAFEILSGALRESPGQPELRLELERLASELGGWQELVELFERLVDEVGDPDAALAMRRALARACDERVNDYDRARGHWELVFELDDTDTEAVESLERIFTRTERWAALVELYLKQAERTLDAGEKIGILGKVCNLYEEVLDDADRAIETYQQILDIDPEHQPAVRGLDRLLTNKERWAELAELLMRQAELEPDPDEQIQVRHRLAALLHEHLDRTGDAIDTFRMILADAPGYADAIASMEHMLHELASLGPDALAYRQQLVDLLEPHFEEQEDWPKLIELLELRFADAPDEFARVELLQQVAEVQEQRMGEPARAFQTVCRAVRLDFANDHVAEEADRLAEGLNAWDRLINVYVDGLEIVEDPSVAVRVLLKLARIFDTRLNHVRNAIECYRRLLTLEPGNPEALDALERLYAGAGAHERLVEVLTEKADRADDIIDKKELYYRICEIWDEVLNDRNRAIEAYRTLLDLDADDLVPIEALLRLYRATGDWQRLVDVYQQKVVLTPQLEEQVDCLFEIAQIQDEFLEDAEAAVQACRQVLDLDPVNAKAFGTLQALFAREQRWLDLLELLEQALSIATSAPAMDAIQMQIAELQVQQLEEVEEAINTLQSVLDRSPGHEGAMAALERILERAEHRDRAARVLEPHYEAADNWAALVRILDVQRAECPDSIGRVELYKRIAGLQEQELGDRRAAFDSVGRAFREDPLDTDLWQDLERLTEALDDRRGFATLLDEVLRASDDGQVQRDVSRRLARLFDQELDSGQEAVEHYRRLLDFDEFDPESLAALDRIYTEASSWEELRDVLQRRVATADPDQTAELRFRLGKLLEGIFEDVAGALEQYRQILWEGPGHLGAREAMDDIGGSHRQHRVEVQEVLEPIFWSEEAHGDLVRLFERRLEVEKGASDQARLHLQVGDLLEQQLNQPRAAFDHFREGVALDYGDGLGLENMKRLVEGLGAWREMADSLELLLVEVHDPILERDLTLQLAAIQRERLGDNAGAEAGYLKVLEQEPDSAQVLAALEGIYRETAEISKLVGVLRSKGAAEYDPSVRTKLLREVATLSEELLDDAAAAEQAHRDILALDESDDAALRALERLVEQRGDSEELVRVLERRVANCMDGAELLTLHRRLGHLALELDRPDEAIERYRSCLDMDPTSEDLLATLRDLYTQAERWNDVKDILLQQLGGCEDDDRRVEHLMAIGRLAEERFDDPEEAEGYVRQVLTLSPGDGEAQRYLEDLLTRLERWWDLVELYRERSREAKDPDLRLELLLRVAQLAQDRLQDLALAKESLQEVLDVDPEHPGAQDGLVRLYEADGDWERCMGILERQLARAEEPERTADLLFRKGRILAERLERSSEAAQTLLLAIEAQAGHMGAIGLLKRIYSGEADWESYAQILDFEIRVRTADDERFELLKEQAEVLQQHLGDADGAVAALERANALRPGDPDISRPLVASYLAAERWSDARPLLESLVEELRAARKFRELPALLHQLGSACLSLGEEDAALQHFKGAHELDATYLPNLGSLGRIYAAREQWQPALKVYQTMLLHQSEIKERSERIEVFCNLGQVRLALGDKRRAKDMFRRALSLDPEHGPSRAGMEQAEG